MDVGSMQELERWADGKCNISLYFNPAYQPKEQQKKLYVYDFNDTHNNLGFNYIEMAIIYIQKLVKRYQEG